MAIDKKVQDAHAKKVMSAVSSVVKKFTTIQEQIHKEILIETARFVFIYKDATFATKVLNEMMPIASTARVESMAFWLQDIAGIAMKYADKLGWHEAHLARDEYKSQNGVEFKYDKDHLQVCRQENLRYWKVAPKTVKAYVPPELEQTTKSAVIQLARGMAIGVLSEAEVQAHIDGLMKEVQEALNSKAVKRWTGEYFSKNKPATPVDQDESLLEASDIVEAKGTDSIESELAELMSDMAE